MILVSLEVVSAMVGCCGACRPARVGPRTVCIEVYAWWVMCVCLLRNVSSMQVFPHYVQMYVGVKYVFLSLLSHMKIDKYRAETENSKQHSTETDSSRQVLDLNFKGARNTAFGASKAIPRRFGSLPTLSPLPTTHSDVCYLCSQEESTATQRLRVFKEPS